MVRPTGIELVSSAPQADTLSIELWALKSDGCCSFLLPYYSNIFVFTFQLNLCFSYSRRKNAYLLYYFYCFSRLLNCYNENMKEEKTGTYVYDKKSGKMVKISDRIPSVKKSGGHCCGGCCGHCGCHED